MREAEFLNLPLIIFFGSAWGGPGAFSDSFNVATKLDAELLNCEKRIMNNGNTGRKNKNKINVTENDSDGEKGCWFQMYKI